MIYPSTVYLNGQFMSNDMASISPDDRGFYFADGVYEVVKYYKGKPFCFEEHINRLKNSLKEIKIEYDVNKLRDVCDSLIKINSLKYEFAGVYIQITRGAEPRNHRLPQNKLAPTVFIRSFNMSTYLKEMSEGVLVMTNEDIRWLKCNVKSIGLLANTLLFEEVASQGAFECMLVRDGNVTEATHSNLLAVKDGKVYTHPDCNLILPGITKSVVLKICRDISIPVIEEPVKFTDIYNYDEWFITGTGSEVVPVVEINNKAVGNGMPGKITRQIQQEFFRRTYEELAGEKIRL